MFCAAVENIENIPSAEFQRTCLCIGDVRVALCGPTHHPRLGAELESFRVSDHDADIEVAVRWNDQLETCAGPPVFDSGAVWKLFRQNDEFIFDFASDAVGPAPYKRMRTRDFASTKVTLNSSLLPEHAWPLEYPADELLITNYLAHHGLGVEVHGCGLIDAETGGHLFLGHSGAGKSTTTRLWKSLRNPEILSDDRIILRFDRGIDVGQGTPTVHVGEAICVASPVHVGQAARLSGASDGAGLWMSGTPWHGEAAFASAGKAEISRIFILKHGERNQITRMPFAVAVGELFARCFPPFHSAAGLQSVVDFLEKTVRTVPCYDFQFVPDSSAVEMALNFHD